MNPRKTVAAVAALALAAGITALAIPTGVAADNPVTVMAAGDIAEAGTSTQANANATGDLIRSANPAYVLTVGDNAYPDGSATDYSTKYEPTWGSFKAKTRPTPGNHEYHSNPPAGYLSYYGQASVTTNNSSSQVWYAWDIGNGWRGYALNSEVSASSGSAQDTWLAADLAAHPNMHYVAYWHQPRYVSGTSHTDQTTMCPLWTRLQTAGADLALVGHEHHYERFAKMDCAGAPSSGGIREFVVGTGGNWLYPLSSPLHANSQSSNATDFGVLKLVLHSNSYDWQFIESGRCFDTSNNTSSDCVTHTGVVIDSGTQATNTTVAGDTAMPALPTGTRHFVTNEGASKAAAAALGYNLHDTAPDAAQVNALPYADKAVVYLGEKCPSGATTAFRASVDALKTNPRVFAYFLSDEPDNPACAAGAKAEADYIHANAPGQLAFIELTDYPGTYAAYGAPGATNVDLFGIDPYPCQRDTNTCDLADIDTQVNAALAAGIPRERLVPTFQAFGLTSTWFPPSAAQLQSILDRWASLVPTPVFDYAYTWACNFGCDANSASISTRTDWQNVLRAYNTTFPNRGTAPTPTPPPSTTPTPTPTPPPAGGTLDRLVATSLDDAEQQGTSMYTSSSDLELTTDGTLVQQVGIRFPNVTIPKGATITAAWVDFTAKEAWSGATSLTFSSQAIDNAPAFTTAANDISARTMNSATVAWSPSGQTVGLHYTSPSLVSLVQAVVNRAGWVSGNGLMIKVTGTGTRTEYAWDGSSTLAPKLHVTW